MNYFASAHTFRVYRLFISHAWDYSDQYDGVKKLMDADSAFTWDDFSIPFDSPVETNPFFPKSYGTIVDQLRERIRQVDCLLVIGGMYAAYRGWIQTEIESAHASNIPVIAIRPLGQERVPMVVQGADDQVGWRTESIIGAIKKLVPSAPTASILLPPPSMTRRSPIYGTYPATDLIDLNRINKLINPTK